MPPSTRLRGILVLGLLGLSWTLSSGAQEQQELSEYERVTRALHVVRQGRVEVEVKDRAMEELLALGTAGPQRLADHLRREGEGLAKDVGKARPKLSRRFFQTAVRCGNARLDGKAQKAMDAARSVVRGLARSGGLTKKQIQERSDPAMEELAELLVVDVEDVLDADEKLAEEHLELLILIEEWTRVCHWWQRAEQALAGHPDGARAHGKLQTLADPGQPTAALARELEFLAHLATPMSERDRDVFRANRAVSRANRDGAPDIDPREAAGVQHLNLMRVRLGLPALAIDVLLCQASRDHSKDMRTLGFFSHTSPVEGKRSVGDRARLAGTTAGAENIAVGADTGEDVIRQWWYSPGHHRNMLGGHSRIGLGRSERHWTQMFG